MVCIYCHAKTSTSNSRATHKGHQVWRRRKCGSCQAVFTTRETVELMDAVRVKPGMNALEPFRRDKLLLSIYGSLSHRKTALQDAGQLAETVIDELIPLMKGGVIATPTISGCLQGVLERFDIAGAVSYRAHHPDRS